MLSSVAAGAYRVLLLIEWFGGGGGVKNVGCLYYSAVEMTMLNFNSLPSEKEKFQQVFYSVFSRFVNLM